MLDFNTKKRILKKLSECGEKHFLMLLPCLIAAGCVKLFYFIACNLGLALSDKDGNFLGIKRASKTRAEKTPKPKKQDDIVYVKRSPWGRLVSAVLAFAFTGMFVPAVSVFAAPQYEKISDHPDLSYSDDITGTTYYFNAGNSKLGKPTLVSSECKEGYGSIYVMYSYSVEAADLAREDGGFADFLIRYEEVDGSGNVIPGGKTDYTVSSGQRFESGTHGKEIIGLDPNKRYKVSVVARQTVFIYGIPDGENISDFIDANGDIMNYYDKSNANGTTTRITVAKARIYRELISEQSKILAPGKRLTNPIINAADMTVTYNPTANSNEIKLDSNLFNRSDVAGYYIYRSYETTDTDGIVSASGYQLLTSNDYPDGRIQINALSDDYKNGTTPFIFTDPRVLSTAKYSYYLVSFAEAYTGAEVISPPPPGGTAKRIWTRTAAPSSADAFSRNTYIEISWPAVAGATSYTVRRFEEGEDYAVSSNYYEFNAVPAVNGKEFYSLTDKRARLRTNYYYVVYAKNANNDNPSPQDVYATSLPAISTVCQVDPSIYVPYNLRVTSSDTDTSVNITWQCKGDDITGFDFEILAESDNLGNPVNANPTYDAQGYINNTVPGVQWNILDVKANAVKLSETTDVNGNKIITYGFNDQGYRLGYTYRFKIRSYMQLMGSTAKDPMSGFVPSPDGYKVKIGTDIYPPQEIEAVSGNNQITVNWEPSSGADRYYLTIEKLNGSRWEEIPGSPKTVTGTSYVHRNLKGGESYRYKVKAVRDFLGEIQESIDWTPYASATVGVKLQKPIDLTISSDEDNNIIINWTPVDGADGYYLCITGDGRTETKDITAPPYTQKNAKYGVTYSYYVQAYKNVQLPNAESPYPYIGDKSATETFTLGGMNGVPSGVKAEAGDGEITVTWNAVAGAEGYMIYATGGGKTETFSTDQSPFVHTGLTPGVKYTYTVAAYKYINGTPVVGTKSAPASATVGGVTDAPIDFTATSSDSSAVLSWTALADTDIKGYTIYGTSDTGASLEIDVSKNTYIHQNLVMGETWTYYVRAFKMINGQKVYGNRSNTATVKIGFMLPAPLDLVATSGNRQVDVNWKEVQDADGYIVYLYNEGSLSFEPLSIVSKGPYSHTGLKNGKKYTYMVAAFKNVGGQRIIGDYSLSVSAIPSAGSASDVDSIINIKGTAPYGISHSELISAGANHEAFDEPIDAYISVNDASTRAVKQVLRNYANGLKSFIIYPFDIKTYLADSLVEAAPNDGYTMTFTMPVPDNMIKYRDYITVIHLRDDGESLVYDDEDDDIFVASNEFEVLPSAIVKINDRWCIQFQTTSCSPFAFVIYRDNLDDISAGAAGTTSGSTAGGFNTGILLFTALPDILPAEKKTRFVVSSKKRYRIKK